MVSKLKNIIKYLIIFFVKLSVLPVAVLLGSAHSLDNIVMGILSNMFRLISGNRLIYGIVDFNNKNINNVNLLENAAIVLQGKIIYKNQFTLQIIKRYRSNYERVPIIVSTWKNEATTEFKKECQQLCVTVLENELPNSPGYGHCNYQLKSSLEGIKKIKTDFTKVDFVLKCRTDQMISRPDFLIYFCNLLNTFHPGGAKLDSRIIFLGNDGTHKYVPFFMCDFMTFGSINDMIRLYNIPYMTTESNYIQNHDILWNTSFAIANFNELSGFSPRKIKQINHIFSKFSFAEVYICKEFYNKYIDPVDNDKILQQYWHFLKEYAIVVNQNDLLLYWPKYVSRVNVIYSCYNKLGSLDFASWLDIYLHYKYTERKA